jgi:hypothetical protein
MTPMRLPAESKGDIVNHINQGEEDREAHLAGYTVTEVYQMYKPGDDAPMGERTVTTTYIRGKGKTYVEQSRYGSFLAQKAFDRILKGEETLSKPENRKAALLNSDNYSMVLVDEGKDPQPSYICNGDRPLTKTRVLEIKPRHPGPELVEGFLWVDVQNYRIVRIRGKFSESPSFWVGRPVIERDYTEGNGFAMAISSCSVSNTWFTGKHTVQITYKDYQYLH